MRFPCFISATSYLFDALFKFVPARALELAELRLHLNPRFTFRRLRLCARDGSVVVLHVPDDLLILSVRDLPVFKRSNQGVANLLAGLFGL